jgi:uncharacterized membrane protein YqjE
VAEPTPQRAPSAESAGIFAHALDLLGAALAYFQARFALASIEGREAAGHYLKALGLLLGGVVIVVFGYFFLCFAAVFAIATAFGGSGMAWIWVTFAAAILHLAIGTALIFKVRSLVHRPVFAATLEEFKKDQAWLETKTAKRS